jgi:hypothetical protein
MADDLFTALINQDLDDNGPFKSGFTFQHRLCHDFESLIWVVVYAMMIHHRNTLAATDPEKYQRYKVALDDCWAVHSYGHLHRCHSYMVKIGCSFNSSKIVSSWFPDPHEAAFFCNAMRLLRNQEEGKAITYESLSRLFEDHKQQTAGRGIARSCCCSKVMLRLGVLTLPSCPWNALNLNIGG